MRSGMIGNLIGILSGLFGILLGGSIGALAGSASDSDDVVGTVGAVNLDYRSLFLHFENNSLFYCASLLNNLKADFEQAQPLCCEVH